MFYLKRYIYFTFIKNIKERSETKLTLILAKNKFLTLMKTNCKFRKVWSNFFSSIKNSWKFFSSIFSLNLVDKDGMINPWHSYPSL